MVAGYGIISSAYVTLKVAPAGWFFETGSETVLVQHEYFVETFHHNQSQKTIWPTLSDKRLNRGKLIC
jgi:hypothetical protein